VAAAAACGCGWRGRAEPETRRGRLLVAAGGDSPASSPSKMSDVSYWPAAALPNGCSAPRPSAGSGDAGPCPADGGGRASANVPAPSSYRATPPCSSVTDVHIPVISLCTDGACTTPRPASAPSRLCRYSAS
jgi:hypothetical protein